MTTDGKYDAHVATWWADERGRTNESPLAQRIALGMRDAFLDYMERIEGEELGERVGGPRGILAAADIKVMRYHGVPSYDNLVLPLSPEFARRQREERNERAVAWLREATGHATSGGVPLTPELTQALADQAEGGYSLTQINPRSLRAIRVSTTA